MILLIDNYDSFVHNLARYFQQLGQTTHVMRNDAADVATIERLRPQAIVLSPGPCTPAEAGCSIDVVRQLAGQLPILGVCLGHQAIGAALGAKIVRAPEPMHGRTSSVSHTESGLFEGVPNPLTVARYHSLVVDEGTLPKELAVTARTVDGTIMALAHRTWPLFGLQFHPESILTVGGYSLLANFLRLAGLPLPDRLPEAELAIPPSKPAWLPDRPVTF
jgi:anthranilate synthase component 2